MTLLPYLHASNNGVSLSHFFLFISAPSSIKYFTANSFPLSHALKSGA